MTKKEIDENDYRVYIASSGSSSEGSSDEEEPALDDANADASTSTTTPAEPKGLSKKEAREARRNKLRSLLLDESNLDDLPEGWGERHHSSKDAEMSVTFAPGLSSKNRDDDVGVDADNETTLERYQRRQKEKKLAKKAKMEAKARGDAKERGEDEEAVPEAAQDEFFGEDSDKEAGPSKGKKGKDKKSKASAMLPPAPKPSVSTAEELQLLVAPSSGDGPASQALRHERGSARGETREVKG